MTKIDELIKKYDMVKVKEDEYRFNSNGIPSVGLALNIVEGRIYLANEVYATPDGINYSSWWSNKNYASHPHLRKLHKQFKKSILDYKKLRTQQKLEDIENDFT